MSNTNTIIKNKIAELDKKGLLNNLTGILFYKKKELFVEIIEFIEKNKSNIISVGSGVGYLEYAINYVLPQFDIKCVDPNPFSFNPPPVNESYCMMPHFSDISEIDDFVITSSLVIISWPNPGDGLYDYNTITKYKPRCFIISYAPCGASGSYNLIQLLAKNKTLLDMNFMYAPSECVEILEIDSVKYHLISCYSLKEGSGYGYDTTYRLVFYMRQDHMQTMGFNTNQKSKKINYVINKQDDACHIS